jgi:hypothetical protein
MACCGQSGSRTNMQTRRRTDTATRPVAGEVLWMVTLPDGTQVGGLTEHQAVVMTVQRGGGMEPQSSSPTATPN